MQVLLPVVFLVKRVLVRVYRGQGRKISSDFPEYLGLGNVLVQSVLGVEDRWSE